MMGTDLFLPQGVVTFIVSRLKSSHFNMNPRVREFCISAKAFPTKILLMFKFGLK